MTLPTPEQYRLSEKLSEIFMPHAETRRKQMIDQKGRFVHYTTAEAAVQIIQSKRVWMRNTSCMADFREIRHGFDLLNQFFNDQSKSKPFFDALNAIHHEIGQKGLIAFNQSWPDIQRHTYISCMSEHDDSEDWNGRLSMWRAFGGATANARVGLVLRLPLESGVAVPLGVTFSPVGYLTIDEVNSELKKVTDNVRLNVAFLRTVDPNIVIATISKMILVAVVSLKHTGFKEEREWRIIYSPRWPSELVKSEIKTVGSIPQMVHMLPLDAAVSDDLELIDLKKIFDRQIIGPTQFAEAMYFAFVAALTNLGVVDANVRVCASNIPIRT